MIPACGRRVHCRGARELSVEVSHTNTSPSRGCFYGAGMATRSNSGVPKILCVESDLAVLESRCAVLKFSGYDAASATLRVAEMVLRSQKFDLIVVSRLSNPDLQRIINLSHGADVLALDALTFPSELISLVAQRLNRHQRKA